MTKEKQIVVEIEDMTVAYQEKPVLWDIDLDIPKGVLNLNEKLNPYFDN